MLLSRTSVPLSMVLGSTDNRGGIERRAHGKFFRGRQGKPMKKLFLLASLVLAASAAQAQCPYARAAAAAARSGATSASGSGNFVPSTFVNYSEALTTGEEQLQAKSGVAEAARTAQAMKNSNAQKPVLVAQQDDGGNLVIFKPRKTGPNGAAATSGQAKLTAVNRQAKVITDENISSSGRP
jgi:hypothetical protein